MLSKSTASFYGMNAPFVGGSQNILSRQEDERLIKNDIIQLLLTVPGERVMRPDFGVQLRSFVFEQLANVDVSQLQAEITNKITKFEPRVIIKTVELIPDYKRNGLNVKVVAMLKKDPNKELIISQFIAGRS